LAIIQERLRRHGVIPPRRWVDVEFEKQTKRLLGDRAGENTMRKSRLFAVILFLLAASFASAGSFFKPSDTDEDFCFGYAICE